MRRSWVVFATVLLVQFLAVTGFAQPDKLAGRWEGKLQSPQGERPATATFKKEGDSYTGSITGLRGDMPLKEIKVDADKVTAKSDLETPQATLLITYTFTLQGETLKGAGSLDFGGNAVTFDIDLKRVGGADALAAPAAGQAAPQTAAPAQPPAQPAQPLRMGAPQPQQKQSLEYFAGEWTFRSMGRESPLGSGGPREGTASFKLKPDGKGLEGHTEGRSDEGISKDSLQITFDEAKKMLNVVERRSNGVEIRSQGDWSSPIGIRFTVDPIKVKGETLQLKRTLSIIAAHSFSITEELSVDGAPFMRLGNALYSRVK